jgi:hypothetical protein
MSREPRWFVWKEVRPLKTGADWYVSHDVQPNTVPHEPCAFTDGRGYVEYHGEITRERFAALMRAVDAE